MRSFARIRRWLPKKTSSKARAARRRFVPCAWNVAVSKLRRKSCALAVGNASWKPVGKTCASPCASSVVVTQRTTEIGIRLVFGAQPAAVLRMVLHQALRPVAAGLAAAVPLAFLASSWLRSLVFGVNPQDPRTIASHSSHRGGAGGVSAGAARRAA